MEDAMASLILKIDSIDDQLILFKDKMDETGL